MPSGCFSLRASPLKFSRKRKIYLDGARFRDLKTKKTKKKVKKNLLLTMSKIKIWGATFNMFENSQKE